MFIDKLKNKAQITATCLRKPGFVATKQGLAYTPAKMMELAERGIPVSASSVGTFFDGVERPSWDVPIERRRGCDPADVWQAQADARYKFHKAKIEKVEISKDD